MKQKISKILVANRGEIALRIIRACKELEIASVAIFSTADLDGIWIRKSDECYPITGDPIQAYLDYERIITLAKKANCDAIHPGYGFLSENADFAKACEDNGLIFIGPKPEYIALFGDKMASKVAMKKLKVPVLEGTDEPVNNVEEGLAISKDIGFPVIIKAAFGGGGRGMRIVREEEQFVELFEAATSESMKFFGRDEVFIEKYVESPRHIEIQIIADKYGNVVHLGERDCSIQRRHQKVIEIAPSPGLKQETREKLYAISTNAMKELGYESVGTMEYLLDAQDNIYFIEMNTRVQVEHPVTEIISGVDIIQRMIEISEGDKLKYTQDQIKLRGYAIEFRLNAEDPQKGFMPSAGKIETYLTPGGPGVRLDTSLYAGYEIPPYYDSMLGKLIVWALDWEGAVKKAKRALDEFHIEGIPTNIPLHRDIVRDEDFKQGRLDTGYLDQKLENFDLSQISYAKLEEERLAEVKALLAIIQKNNIEVRH